MSAYIKLSGVWKKAKKIFIWAGGLKEAKRGFYKANNVWKQFYTSYIPPVPQYRNFELIQAILNQQTGTTKSATAAAYHPPDHLGGYLQGISFDTVGNFDDTILYRWIYVLEYDPNHPAPNNDGGMQLRNMMTGAYVPLLKASSHRWELTVENPSGTPRESPYEHWLGDNDGVVEYEMLPF